MLAPRFAFAWRFPKGEARALVYTCDGSAAFIDPAGVVAIAPRRERAAMWSDPSFHEGRVVVPDANSDRDPPEFEVLNESGHVVFKTAGAAGFFAHGLLGISGRSGRMRTVEFRDRDGGVAIPSQQGACWPCVFGDDGLAAITRLPDDKIGYIDVRGHWAIPPQFDAALPFENGFAVVGMGQKHGMIDNSGAVLVALRFDDIGRFSEGLAWARIGEETGFVDMRGEFAIAPQFGAVPEGGDFSEGLAAVRLADGAGSVGFVDHHGMVVIAPRFRNAGHFRNGLAPAAEVSPVDRRATVCGYIDKSGRWITERHWGRCPDFDDGIAMPSMFQGILSGVDGPPAAVDYVNRIGHIIGHLEYDEDGCGRASDTR